jgi:hypothetical protein
MDALEVYKGSDGELTKRYYALLALSGTIGSIAMNLFRAQKCSARAKVYRGGVRGRGSYKAMSYDKKGWSIEQLCKVLVMHPEVGLRFGWKEDPKLKALQGPENPNPPVWVLYVDLPEGQVSFHSPTRYAGPDYPADWDQVKDASIMRILTFCNRIVKERLECPSPLLNSVSDCLPPP